MWVGRPTDPPPVQLDAIIDTTPAWRPVVEALKNLAPGGRLVVNAIRKEEADKSDLLRIDYASSLWLEKEIKTVANVTRQDVREFLSLAAELPVRPRTRTFALSEANAALVELKMRGVPGAKVLAVE